MSAELIKADTCFGVYCGGNAEQGVKELGKINWEAWQQLADYINTAAASQLAKIAHSIPITFYGSAALHFRVEQLVRIWQEATKANLALESWRRTAEKLQGELTAARATVVHLRQELADEYSADKQIQAQIEKMQADLDQAEATVREMKEMIGGKRGRL